jgi:hypothetical protein
MMLSVAAIALCLAAAPPPPVGQRPLAPAEPTAPDRGPLPSPWAAAFASLAADPPPPKLNNDKHYLTSNEDHLDRFHRRARKRGGVFVGVGSDQVYVFIGWAQPVMAILMDFDQAVVDLHDVHRAALLAAADPADALALWSPEGGERLAVAVRAHVPEARRGRALALAREARAEVHKRLVRARRDLRDAGVASLWSDADQLARVQGLLRQGRVVAVRGDLTGPATVRAIATAVARAGWVVRVLYLSNAEQYFMFKQPYRDNMLALPMDRRTVVLRTLPARPRDFEYLVQSGASFRAWLKRRSTRSVYKMRGFVRGQDLVEGDLFEIGPPPR